MEACASSHFWARFLISRGFEVVLLPAQYVRPYRRRNKTDRADCEAILEADRCAGIHPVAVKSEDQQALVGLHRVRSQWLESRTARINAMRGLLHEFGLCGAPGAKRFMNELHPFLASKQLPPRVRRTIDMLWDEVRDLEQRIQAVETELEGVARANQVMQRLLAIPGIGLLTATALFAWLLPTSRSRSSRPGHSSGRAKAIATRPPSRSPTSSPASPGPSGIMSALSTVTTSPASPPDFAPAQKNERCLQKKEPTPEVAHSEHRDMAGRSVRRRGKAGNGVGPLRPLSPIGSRCANSMVARSAGSTHEAGYTTAADSLCPGHGQLRY